MSHIHILRTSDLMCSVLVSDVDFFCWIRCGHCKNLAPKYERAAKVLKEAPVPMLLAKVDATLEKDLANKYNVTGFPSLFVFRNGRHYSYKGGREEGGGCFDFCSLISP